MKSVRLHEVGDLRTHDEDIPIPAEGEKLFRVTSVGICGSDLHWFSHRCIGDAGFTQPLVLGHEFSARTESGERVAVDPAIPCRKCEYCLKGNPNLCPEVRFAGYGDMDGAMREWMSWDEQCLVPLPDELSDDDGAMLEPLGVALHAVDLAHIRTGMSIGVFGCGPVGLLILQAARLAGAQRVIATDILSHRVEAARALGADHAYRVAGRLPVSLLQEATSGRGVDVAFEAAGAQDAVDDSIAAVIPGGKVIVVGISVDERTSFITSDSRHKGLTIKLVRRMKHTYPRAIALVQKGLIDVRSLVTHHFPLSQAMQAFKTAEQREGLKVMIHI